jgi:DNA primase
MEFASSPSATPEDRAGLKQRLGVHLANIADAEIRHHYSEAFRERFDRQFASPPRPAFQTGKRFAHKRSTTSEARNIGAQGSDLLVRGVIAGLINNPSQILRHHEALTSVIPREKDVARLFRAIIDAAMTKETLDRDTLLTILDGDLYNMAQSVLSGDGSAFAFARPNPTGETGFSAGVLAPGLDEAIQLMRERPQLEAALKQATEDASSDLTEESFAQQQRLRAEKEDFDRRLAALFQRDDIG